MEPVDSCARAVVAHGRPCYDRHASEGLSIALVSLKCASQHPIAAVRPPQALAPHVGDSRGLKNGTVHHRGARIFHRLRFSSRSFHRLQEAGTSKRPRQAAFLRWARLSALSGLPDPRKGSPDMTGYPEGYSHRRFARHQSASA